MSDKPGADEDAPTWEPPEATRSEPVRLGPKTVDEFVAWVAAAPAHRTEEIRKLIAAGCDDDVVEALGAALLARPVSDAGNLLIVLAILGESRHPAAFGPLVRFITTVEPLFETVEYPPVRLGGNAIDCDLNLNMGGALRARAVEMLCYLKTEQALNATLTFVSDHPEADVRHAAIDAYLFNLADSGEAAAAIRRRVRDEDRAWVAVPRRTSDMDGHAFDARLAELHAEDEMPPIPKAGRSRPTMVAVQADRSPEADKPPQAR